MLGDVRRGGRTPVMMRIAVVSVSARLWPCAVLEVLRVDWGMCEPRSPGFVSWGSWRERGNVR